MALSSDWKFRCQISGVDSDIQVNGGADADPKKQVCVGGGGGGGLRAPVWVRVRKGA